jgi:replicative DNA helicase
MLERLHHIPPHDIETEQAILGAVLVSNAAIDKLGALEPADFYDPTHQVLFAAMRDQWSTVRAINAVTLLAALRKLPDVTDELSAREYLLRLVKRSTELGETSNIEALATAQREFANRRRLVDTALVIDVAARDLSFGVQRAASIAVSALDDVLAAARIKGPTRVSAGQAFRDVLEAALNDDGSSRLTTGLTSLDAVTGGWRRKQLAILAGRPSMGKTAVATSAMLRTAKAGIGVLYFSLEMPTNDLAARCLADLSWKHERPIPYADLMAGRLSDLGYGAFGSTAAHYASLGKLPLVIEDESGLTMAEIAARTRAEAQRMEREGISLGLVIVDHLGKIRPSGRYAGNKVLETGEISDALAALAKSENVAVLALHQLNRAVEARENKRPELADLRNSGDLEQDADLVCFAYREAYYLERLKCDPGTQEELEREAALVACANSLELLVAKQRNGPTTTVHLYCDMACNVVRDLART